MVNPRVKLFKWGTIDGRPTYPDFFTEAFVVFPKYYTATWPDMIGYFKEDKMAFICEQSKIENSGKIIFQQYLTDPYKVKIEYEEWFASAEKLSCFVDLKLASMSLSELSNSFHEFSEANVTFWIKGFLPELGNYAGEKLLRREIEKVYPNDSVEILEGLSAPEKMSFFQTEELEFLKIKLIKNKSKQLKKLQGHQKKYFWLNNSYLSTEVLDLDFFLQRLNNISHEQALKKVDGINGYIDRVIERKRNLIAEHQIRSGILEYAQSLAFAVWWQDHRKKYIFIANHIVTSYLTEISKRTSIPFKELTYYRYKEIEDLLAESKRVDAKERFKGFITYYEEGSDKLISMQGKPALDFIAPYLRGELKEKVKEFSGMVVSRGSKDVTIGKVAVILSPREIEKMEKDAVIVAEMTSPDYVVAMRKAVAVITDEGGMTCHAAIVSRELGLPCIVGTKVATKALKDGDIVEVDTKIGQVRKLKEG